ncbi:hypothetical protein [cf. Phormidesmis sp. LEGE 11477]|uniref:hypothetical protein n=1 Tax=cf. Phormidesmis sp. LEGE 11477 TaxID=1828680 RepID=UPI00187E8F86|nr:hypothetical protein [cf. Phormidesmis sp. LEGE 11477]MBE9063976.1 hypothetical protein [cf. Phormidesmis sp. LEGE 11477]
MPVFIPQKSRFKIAAIASLTLLAIGCSRSMPSAEGGATHRASSADTASTQTTAQAAASEDMGFTDSEAHSHKGVNTNHDVFHSKAIEVPAGTPVPAVTIQVEADPVRGWNLYVGTANFDFTPEKINRESSPTEGHAHLYINDEPMYRIYGPWTHLPDLPGGTNEIRVTLNANGHESLTTQGNQIEDSVTVEVYDPSTN